MKSPQDKICDALTLVGLLCVIAFGSWSLLPESEVRIVQPAQEEAPLDDALPADTIAEVSTRPEVAHPAEEFADSLIGDTLAIEDTFEADTVAVAHGSEQENALPTHHEDSSTTESETGTNASHKKAEETHTHSVQTESLME